MSSYSMTMTVLLSLSSSESLKDKRSVVRGIIDRFGRLKNIAASETGYKDSVNVAELTFSIVGDSPTFVENEVERLISGIESSYELTLSIRHKEWYQAGGKR